MADFSTGSYHIAVCICTYKRAQFLAKVLEMLLDQTTDSLFNYSIVIVDNDNRESAKNVFLEAKKKANIDIEYFIERNQNISLARNKAIKKAKGNLIAFIDDDEYPENNWLLNLFKTFNKYRADGVLGPVMPYFEKRAPGWVRKIGIYKTKDRKSGAVLKWDETRTSNLLINSDIFIDEKNHFDIKFGLTGGGDVDFFKRMIEIGYIFVWCAEAPVYEHITMDRCSMKWIAKRSIRAGVDHLKLSKKGKFATFRIYIFIRAIATILIYIAIMPTLSICGITVLVNWLIKLFYHYGTILGLLGYKMNWYNS